MYKYRVLPPLEKRMMEHGDENEGFELFSLSPAVVALLLKMKGAPNYDEWSADLQYLMSEIREKFKTEKARVVNLKLGLKRAVADNYLLQKGLEHASDAADLYQRENKKLKATLKLCVDIRSAHEIRLQNENLHLRRELERHTKEHVLRLQNENLYLRRELERRTGEFKSRMQVLNDTLLYMFRSQEQGMYDLAREVEHRETEDEQVHEVNDQLQQIVKKLKETEKTLDVVKTERTVLYSFEQDLESKLRTNDDRIKEIEEVNGKIISSQQLIIQQLEHKLDDRDLKLRQLEKTSRLKTETKLVEDLKESVKSVLELKNQLKQTAAKLTETEVELEKSKLEKDLQIATRQDLETKSRQDEARIHDLQVVYETIPFQNQMIDQLKEEVKCQHEKMKGLQELLESKQYEDRERNDLRINLKEKEEQVSDLREQLKEVLIKRKETESILNETNRRACVEQKIRQDLEENVREGEKKVKDLKETTEEIISSLKYKIQILETDLKCMDRKVESLEDVKELSKHLKDTEEKLSKTEAKLDEVKSERESLQVVIQDLEGKAREYQLTIKGLKESSDGQVSYQKTAQNLQKEVEDKDIEVKKLKKLIDDIKHEFSSDRDKLRRYLKEKEDQIQDLKYQLDTVSTILNEKKKEIHEFKCEINLEKHTEKDIETQVSTRIKELRESSDNIILSQKQKIQHLENLVERLELKVNGLEEQLYDSTSKNEGERYQLHKELKEKEDKISEIKDQLKQDYAEMNDKRTELNVVKRERDFQQIRIQELEKIIEGRDKKLKDTEQCLDSKNKEVSDSNKLKKEVEEMECQLSARKDQLEETVAKLEKMTAELVESKAERNLQLLTIQELSKEVDAKNNQIREQKSQTEKMFAKLKETESKVNDLNPQKDIHQHVVDELQKKVRRYETQIKDFEKINEQTTSSQSQIIKHLEREVEHFKEKLSEAGDKLQHALTKLQETETELDETRTRLSKAMGDKLTDNNPNIADLSDKNRPIKLAERFAELYDNEWTDAYDIIGKHFSSEQSTVDALLDILQDVMGFCNGHGHRQMENLQTVLGFSETPEGGKVPSDVRKHFKDCRKAMTSTAVRNLYKMYVSHIRTSTNRTLKTSLEISSYLKECVEICWLMVIQDPPVVFAPTAERGTKLNTDVYKPYTCSGTHVEYTVWPALLLHEGGPVLAKGVSQGYGKKSERRK